MPQLHRFGWLEDWPTSGASTRAPKNICHKVLAFVVHCDARAIAKANIRIENGAQLLDGTITVSIIDRLRGDTSQPELMHQITNLHTGCMESVEYCGVEIYLQR